MAPVQKNVVVLGATGQQGGSVVQELLREPSKYHIHGLTRNTQSVKSRALASQGVDVVQANLDDSESLEHAFEGAHVIYAMTDFWQSMSADTELKQAISIANIAEALPQLQHFVWASLPDGKALSEGKYANIFHWQSKAALTEYLRTQKPALWAKTIEILFPNYFENCVTNPSVYLPVKVSCRSSSPRSRLSQILMSLTASGWDLRAFILLGGSDPAPKLGHFRHRQAGKVLDRAR